MAGDTSIPDSTRPRFVAPTAKMTPSVSRRNTTELVSHPAKGKGRAISPVAEQASTPHGVNEMASEHERPVLESDILSDSDEQALADARRYQAQVDRSERRRDREDADFDPLVESQKQLDRRLRETPRTRSRKATQPKATASPSGRRFVAQQDQGKEPQNSVLQKQLVLQKRKADVESPLEHIQHPFNGTGVTLSRLHHATDAESEPYHKRYKSERHYNKQFTKLKPESQSKRKQYIKSILKFWKINLEQLMTFPYAPRRTVVLQPLDWNSALLEALAQLALVTKGDFAKGCDFARDALERSSIKGTKQITAKILLSAIAQQETASGGSDASPHQLVGSSSDRRDARSKTLSVQPPNPPSPTVHSPDTTGQAPPSPAASPVAAPALPSANAIKSEPTDATAQHDIAMQFGSQSSVTEERLDLESRAKILSYQLATVREQMKMNERRKRDRERKAARTGRLGGSASQPLVL